MSKKSKKRLAADGEFMTLVRCQPNTIALHKDPEPRDGAAYWKRKYEELEENVDAIIANYESAIDSLEKTIALKDDTIKTLNECLALQDAMSEPEVEEVEEERPFRQGLGLSITPGEDPRLYRLSDPNGDLIPKHKIKGADFEIQPGRGFQIRIRRG